MKIVIYMLSIGVLEEAVVVTAPVLSDISE